jgi:archaellum component FlaG (FlaF/FlaG flagellin family)
MTDLGSIPAWTAVLFLASLLVSAAVAGTAFVWKLAQYAAGIKLAVDTLVEDMRRMRHDQKNDQQAISLLRTAVEVMRADLEQLERRLGDLEKAA